MELSLPGATPLSPPSVTPSFKPGSAGASVSHKLQPLAIDGIESVESASAAPGAAIRIVSTRDAVTESKLGTETLGLPSASTPNGAVLRNFDGFQDTARASGASTARSESGTPGMSRQPSRKAPIVASPVTPSADKSKDSNATVTATVNATGVKPPDAPMGTQSKRGALPVTTLAVREQSYIPLALAKKTIDQMENKMRLMQSKHNSELSNVKSYYGQVETESREYYNGFIKRLQAGARAELSVYKAAVRAAEMRCEVLTEERRGEVGSLRDRVSALEAQLAEALRQHGADTQQSAAKHEEVVAAMKNEYDADVSALKEKLSATKTKAKEKLAEAEEKYGALVGARDEVIVFLEADRRRLISAVNELHGARDALATALHQMEKETNSVTDSQMKDAHGLSARLAQAEQTIANQLQSIITANAAKTAAEARASAAEERAKALEAEVESMKNAFASANASIAAISQSATASSSPDDINAALTSAQVEIAQLKVKLAGANAARAKSDPQESAGVVAALKAEQEAMSAELNAVKTTRDALQSEVLRLRAAAAEAEIAHKISIAEAKARILQDASVEVAKATMGADAHALRGEAKEDGGRLNEVSSAELVRMLRAMIAHAEETIRSGEALWIEKKKRQALKLYEEEAHALQAQLPVDHELHALAKSAVDEAAEKMAENQPAKAAFVLKQSIEKFILDGTAWLQVASKEESEKAGPTPLNISQAELAALKAELQKVRLDNARALQSPVLDVPLSTPHSAASGVHSVHHGLPAPGGSGASASTAALVAALSRAETAEAQVRQLTLELNELRAETDNTRGDGAYGAGDEDDAPSKEDDDTAADGEEEGNASEENEGKTASTTASPAKGKDLARTGTVTAGAGAQSTTAKPAAAMSTRDANKLKEQDKLIKELRTKIRTLEANAAKAGSSKVSATPVVDEKAMQAALEKRQAVLEKKWKKEKEDMEKDHSRDMDMLTKKFTKLQGEMTETQAALAALTAERDALKKRAAGAAEMEKELEALRAAAEEGRKARVELDAANVRIGELEKLYKDEQILRKRYYNIIEDMKGKIRVYCRARPMSTSELDRGNFSVVTFPDEVTIDLDTGKGRKQFIYDQCFGPSSTQEEVFSDTENLIQSAYDGYNVAIFAYGQTGSGKTFTMVGSRDMPGVTPRAVRRIFDLAEANKATYDTQVQVYMVELYLDNLIDLFHKVDNPKDRSEGPKLDIKKDEKGLVVIKGVTIKDCADADSALEFFDAGNSVRHVGSTQMNATSSRSHLVFALLVNTYNRQTKKSTTGKISLIDLAGSERVGKTGASADRLKEAQSINKSLSALGNVISALSTNASFIPYRDNKLTQLMSDSLGGNAKTLMFVNLSPADYNAEETQSSLVYASRVKLITNNAEKMQESQEVARLKKIILQLKNGIVPADLNEVDVSDGGTTPAPDTPAPDYGDGDEPETPAGAGVEEP